MKSCAALIHLDGLQVRRHDSSHPAVSAPPAPAVAQSVARPAAPAFPPPLPAAKRKAPLALIGFAAAVLLLGAGGYFVLHKPGGQNLADSHESEPHGDGGETTPDVTPPVTPDDPPPEKTTPLPPPPPPTTPAPPPMTPAPPTRQDMLKARVAKAQALEEKGEWSPSLDAWLGIAGEFPESPVAKNHLETLLNRLRDRPSPISLAEFKEMRPQITDAAQLDILSAMMLIADNVREYEPATAFNWYSTAAAKGHAPALTQLGLMLSNGAGTDKPDLVKAAQSFQAAADKGDVPGKFALGECHLFGKGVVKNEVRAVELLLEAVAGGDARAMDRLGDCYNRGLGVKVDYAEALRLFTRASELGNRPAMGNLGVLYITGRGMAAPNPKKAAELFDKGARAGDSASMFNYAQCLEEGIGTARNQLQSQAWYRKSAEAGDKRGADWCRKHGVPFTAP